MRIAALLVVAAAALSFPAPARADVVRPPPADCPPGSLGKTSHSGQFCAPLPCTADSDCATHSQPGEPALVCRTSRLCIGSKELHSWRTDTSWKVPVALGPCGASCPPASCQTEKRCVPDPDAGPAAPPEQPTATATATAPTPTPTPAPAPDAGQPAHAGQPSTAPAPPATPPTAAPGIGCGCDLARSREGAGGAAAWLLASVAMIARARARRGGARSRGPGGRRGPQAARSR